MTIRPLFLVGYVVALCALILPHHGSHAASGSITISGRSLEIKIPNLVGTINIVADPSITNPIVDYETPAVVTNAFLSQQEGAVLNFDAYAFNPTSTVTTSSTRPTTTATATTASSSSSPGGGVLNIVGSGSSLRPGSWSTLVASSLSILGLVGGAERRFVVLAAASFAYVALDTMMVNVDAAPSPHSITITIRLPVLYTFDSFKITAPYSTLSSAPNAFLYASSVTLNQCGPDSTPALSHIDLAGGTFVYDAITACATGNVNLHKLRTVSSQVSVSVESASQSVNATYVSGYFGKWTASAGQANVIMRGDCFADATWTGVSYEAGGACGKMKLNNPPASSSSRFVARSGRVFVDFGYGCRSDWVSDPVPKDVPPPNPPVLPQVQPYTVNISEADPRSWSYYTPTGQRNAGSLGCPGAQGCEPDDDGAAQVGMTSWGNQAPFSWYTLPNRVLPSILGDITYRISFDVRMDVRNLRNRPDAYTTLKYSIVLFEHYEAVWHKAESTWNYFIEDDAYLNPVYSLGYCDVDHTLISNTTYHTASCSITASRDSDHVVIGLRGYTPGFGDAQWFYFKNLVVHMPLTPVRQPTLITKDSELITLRYPSPEFDPNPRGIIDCPHLQTGLRHWHDDSLWPGGMMPSASSNIVLPANTKVLVSSCSFSEDDVYKRIEIPSTSELIFSDAPITLHVQDIYVMGALRIGSPTCRILSPIEITFHGENITTDTIATHFGTKGVGVAPGGMLDIHGKQYHKTWARLADSAKGGDDRVHLLDDVNWEPGQQIVVSATILVDEWHNQNEIVTIVSVSGRTVVFTPPLRYHHYGEQAYQAEVGLLSRRIVLQGDFADSEANNASFGGHIMVQGKGRFSGVEFTRMGQLNRLARYPVHYHMIRDGGKDSYVKDSSFWHNFYRCVSIHGTNHATVTRNVAFDIQGHCYYLEDGTEENNEISYNMAAYIHPINRPIIGWAQAGEFMFESDDLRNPADAGAAGYYITNAYNTIIGNAASGGWVGFSFPNLYRPIQLNAWQAPFNPSGRPALEFDGNTARGSGNIFGNSGCFYVGGHLFHIKSNDDPWHEDWEDNTGTKILGYQNGRVERSTVWQNVTHPDQTRPANLTFTNIKASLCSMGVGDWSDLQVINYESHDNFRSAMMFGKSWMGNGLVVGRTSNPLSGTPPLGRTQGFEFYDTYTHTLLTNVTFRNFQRMPGLNSSNPHDDNRVFVCMTHSDTFKPEGMSATRNITFENVDETIIVGVKIQDTGSSRMFNLYDTDGSVARHMGMDTHGEPAIIGSYVPWWKFNDLCILNEDWNAYVCPKTVPEQQIVTLGLYLPGLIDYGQIGRPDDHIGEISLFGDGIPRDEVRGIALTRNSGVTGMSHVNWYMIVNDTMYGAPTSIEVNTIQVPNNTWVMFATPYPIGTTFRVWSDLWNNRWLPGYYEFVQVYSYDAVRYGNGTTYFVDDDGIFYMKVVDFSIKLAAVYENFYRDGAEIKEFNNGFVYHVRATCVNTKTIDIQPSSTQPNPTTFCVGANNSVRPAWG